MSKFIYIITFLILSLNISSQEVPFFPDLKDYYTLQCDLHMHTVFSDGLVWPDLRVTEALKDNLDAIAITDHIEYRPYQDDVKGDHNKSYEIAAKAGTEKGIIVIKGTEITRSMPPGHFNALFIEDANKIDTKKVFDAIEEAKSQGGFLIWNHPGWKAQQPDTTMWFDIHTELYNKGLINGIEIFNYSNFYPEALTWANEKKLTMFASSDVHQTIRTGGFGDHRPITLVFANDYSAEAIESAIVSGRTACYFGDTIVAFQPYLSELLDVSLNVSTKVIQESGYTIWSFTNTCSCPIVLEIQTPTDNEDIPNTILIKANSSEKIRFLSPKRDSGFIVYNVLNWFHNNNSYAQLKIPYKSNK